MLGISLRVHVTHLFTNRLPQVAMLPPEQLAALWRRSLSASGQHTLLRCVELRVEHGLHFDTKLRHRHCNERQFRFLQVRMHFS